MLKKNLPSESYYQELAVLTEQKFEMKEREKAITVAEQLSHALRCYEPAFVPTSILVFLTPVAVPLSHVLVEIIIAARNSSIFASNLKVCNAFVCAIQAKPL